MDKEDFLAWARSWAESGSANYDSKAAEVEKFDKKAAELLRGVGSSVASLSSYLKTKLSDTH